MEPNISGLFDDVFTVFSTMGWTNDFFERNPELNNDQTYYTMKLNNCVNRVASHLVDLQEIINMRQNVLDISTKQNAIDYITAFWDAGNPKQNLILNELNNFIRTADAAGNVEVKLKAINDYAIEADSYAAEFRKVDNEKKTL